MKYIQLSDQQITEYYAAIATTEQKQSYIPATKLQWLATNELLLNEYIIFQYDGQKPLGAFRYSTDGCLYGTPFVALGDGRSKFIPLNIEQQCYFDLLNNENISIKICIGKAGSGKTKAALKFGFQRLLDNNHPIKKIMLVREPIGLGNGVGYFKGGKDEKLLLWNNPAKDNLENETQLTFEEMISKGMIEIEIPSLMQGRDIKNAWIVVDEAQNLTLQQFKMIGERVSTGSQIIFIGDLNQVVDTKFEKDSGLFRALSLQGKHHLLGLVCLKEDVRSEISRFFADEF